MISDRTLFTHRSIKFRFRLSVESLPEVTEEMVSSSSCRLSDLSIVGSGRSSGAPGVDCNRASELCVRDGGTGVSGGDVTLAAVPEHSSNPSTLWVRDGGDVSLRRRARADVIGLVGGRQAGVSGLDDLRRLAGPSSQSRLPLTSLSLPLPLSLECILW